MHILYCLIFKKPYSLPYAYARGKEHIAGNHA